MFELNLESTLTPYEQYLSYCTWLKGWKQFEPDIGGDPFTGDTFWVAKDKARQVLEDYFKAHPKAKKSAQKEQEVNTMTPAQQMALGGRKNPTHTPAQVYRSTFAEDTSDIDKYGVPELQQDIALAAKEEELKMNGSYKRFQKLQPCKTCSAPVRWAQNFGNKWSMLEPDYTRHHCVEGMGTPVVKA
jgi:hypothetical protein